MTDGIFMDRISGGLANRESVGRALPRRLSRRYRIVADRSKGQSVFRASRSAQARESAPHPTQFDHDSTKKKAPTCELHYCDGARVTLFRARRIALKDGTFKPIGGS
jgi:hypothetical protein